MDDEKKYSQRDVDVMELQKGINQISRTVSTIPKLTNDIANIRNNIHNLDLKYLTREEYFRDKKTEQESITNRRKPWIDTVWYILRNLSWVIIMVFFALIFRNSDLITAILGIK